eukprot:s4409_g1.t1
MRWKRGWCRGPASDVKRGHLIVREDGGLTIAKSVKFNVVDPLKDMKDLLPPAVAEGLPEDMLLSSEPPTKKDLRDEVEFQARMLNEEENFDIDKVVELFRYLETLGDSDMRIRDKSAFSSWYTGAFVHGGVAGIRNNLKEFPQTTKYLTNVAKKYCGDVKFSAVALAKNAQLGLHRDSHNYKLSKNYVIPLQSFEGGALWVQNMDYEDLEGEEKTLPNGKVAYGKIYDMKKGEPVIFPPRVWHEVQPWQGERLVMLLYTPSTTKLSAEGVEHLEEAGFNVDYNSLVPDDEEDADEEPARHEVSAFSTAKAIMMVIKPGVNLGCGFVELEDIELFRGVWDDGLQCTGTTSSATSDVDSHIKKMVKKAEVQYTPNIESILDEIESRGGQLEVTHTVSLADVKGNISKWKLSALKEFNNLTVSKKAFTVKKRHELPPNCRLIRTTDVRQAFVLAKWTGEPVALEPPGIAYALELAVPGDMWYVEQALYGLRESPALWSRFRDEQLKLARWEMIINGKPMMMKLEQLISDNQVWRIIPETGPKEVFGYVLVYIDDLLIHAQEEAMYGFFKWVSMKWEVDDLDVLDFDHPIRFLGMEMHRVPDGVELAQEGFINEILRSYNHKGGRSLSQGPRETLLLTEEKERALVDADPVTVDPKDPSVKEAQRRVGELLWLMGRTRPDIQHTVSIMASRITRAPEMVNTLGRRILDYLNETKHYRLSFAGTEEENVKAVSVHTDSSFAPSGGRSHGAVAVILGNNPFQDEITYMYSVNAGV